MRRQLSPDARKPERGALLLRTICGLLLATTLTSEVGAQRRRSPDEYRNVNFGYAVRLPVGLKIETSQPPNPNHGFLVRLAPTTQLWVDASSTDALTLDAAVAEEHEIRGDRCRETRRKPNRLGRLSAVEIAWRCMGESSGNDSTIKTTVVAVRGGIKYTVNSQWPVDGDTANKTERILRRLIAGFYLISRR